MDRRSLRRMVVSSAASLAIAATIAGPASAARPSVDTWTNSVDRYYLSCDGFDVNGVWEISHKLTFYLDASGVPVRDMEQVEFVGHFVNTVTGASVPDSGSIRWFDTLAPDGSYLTTYQTTVRHSRWIHGAGRIDFQLGVYHGNDGEDAAGVAALCAALGE